MRFYPFPLFVSYLILIGCEDSTAPGTDRNVHVSISGCLSDAPKRPVDTVMLAPATYIGKDSLDFTLSSVPFQCGSEYVFPYPTLIDAGTLAIKIERIHDSGAKCICLKDVHLAIKSKGEDFSSVKTVSLGETRYALERPMHR